MCHALPGADELSRPERALASEQAAEIEVGQDRTTAVGEQPHVIAAAGTARPGRVPCQIIGGPPDGADGSACSSGAPRTIEAVSRPPSSVASISRMRSTGLVAGECSGAATPCLPMSLDVETMDVLLSFDRLARWPAQDARSSAVACSHCARVRPSEPRRVRLRARRR